MKSNPLAPSPKQTHLLNGLCRAAVFTALTCILAPLSIPIGPIPISLTTLVLYLALYLLGWKLSTASLIAYLALGMAGAPVFSGFSGGAGKLFGPTGGYLIGFLPLVLVSGWVLAHTSTRWVQFLGFVLGTALCYAFGTAWFCFQTKSALGPALAVCVYPFLPFDLLKIILAILLGPGIRKQLVMAGLLS